MSYDQNRKLTPLQMEQFIIHLKSEIEKYKNKTEVYKRDNLKQSFKELTERNSHLSDELGALRESVEAKDDELDILKEAVNAKDDEIEQLRSLIHNLTKNEEKLKNRVQELQGVFSHLQTQELQYKDQLETFTKENEDLRRLVAELKDMVDKSKDETVQENKKTILQSATDDEPITKPMFIPHVSKHESQFTKGIIALNNTYSQNSSPLGTEELNPLHKFLERNPLYRQGVGTSVNPFKKI